MNYKDQMSLMHFGVQGMRWGVRRAQKKEFGLSRIEAKKLIKKKASLALDNETTKVSKEYKEAIKKEYKIQKLDRLYKKVEKASKDDPDLFEQKQMEWDKKRELVYHKVGKDFVDKFNIAKLKDIGYTDIEKGKKMLDAYNLSDTNTKSGVGRDYWWGSHRR